MYIIDSREVENGRTKALVIDNNELKVITTKRLPSSEECPHCKELGLSRFGDTVKLGDFCEGQIDKNSIYFTKGDSNIRNVVSDYLGLKDTCKWVRG